MATLRELVTTWAFDINDKPLKNVEEKFSNLTSSVKTLAVGMAGAAGTIFGFVKLTANAGDEARKASQKWGVGVETLQELKHAASLSGMDVEALGSGLRLLGRNMVMAAEGGKKQAEAFKHIGIATRDSNGKLLASDAVLMKIADKFKAMPDGVEKTALSMQLFGKSGAGMIPMLNGGSAALVEMRQEAHDLGLVLSADATMQSEEFNDTLERMHRAVDGIKNIVGMKLMPELTKIGKAFVAFVKANRALIATRVERFLNALVRFLGMAYSFSANLVDAITGLARVFGELGNVLQAVAIGFAVFTAGKVLYGIGNLVGAVMHLGKAFTLANAQALLIPILVGAAIVALGLIIEDIVSFFQGKDSVTGIIVERFREMFLSVTNGFNGLSMRARFFLGLILTPVRVLINTFQTLLNLVDVLRGKMSIKDFGLKTLKNFANMAGFGSRDSLRGAIGLGDTAEMEARKSPLGGLGAEVSAGASQFIVPEMGEVSTGLGLGPSAGAGVLAPTNTSSMNNVVNVDVAVNAGEREDAAVLGRQVGSKTAGELDAVMRDTFRNFQGAGGY